MAEQGGSTHIQLSEGALAAFYKNCLRPGVFDRTQLSDRPEAIFLGLRPEPFDYGYAFNSLDKQRREAGEGPAKIDPGYLLAVLYSSLEDPSQTMGMAALAEHLTPNINVLTRFALTEAVAAQVPIVGSLPLWEPQEMERRLALVKPGYEVTLQVVVPSQGQQIWLNQQAKVQDLANGYSWQAVSFGDQDGIARMWVGMEAALQFGVDKIEFVNAFGQLLYDPTQDARLKFNPALARDAQFLTGMAATLLQRPPIKIEVPTEIAAWSILRTMVAEPNGLNYGLNQGLNRLSPQDRADILREIDFERALAQGQGVRPADQNQNFPLPDWVQQQISRQNELDAPLVTVGLAAAPQRLLANVELDTRVRQLIADFPLYFPLANGTEQDQQQKPNLVVVVAEPPLYEVDHVLGAQQEALHQQGRQGYSGVWSIEPRWIAGRHQLGELAPPGDRIYLVDRVIDLAREGSKTAVVNADLLPGPFDVGKMTSPFSLVKDEEGCLKYQTTLVIALGSEDGVQLQGVQAWVEKLKVHLASSNVARPASLLVPPLVSPPPFESKNLNPDRTDPVLCDLMASASSRFGFGQIHMVDEVGTRLTSGRCPISDAAQMLQDARQANQTLAPAKATYLAQGWQEACQALAVLSKTPALHSVVKTIETVLHAAQERRDYFAAQDYALHGVRPATPLGRTSDIAASSALQESSSHPELSPLQRPDPAQWYFGRIAPQFFQEKSAPVEGNRARGEISSVDGRKEQSPGRVIWVGGEPGVNKQAAIAAATAELKEESVLISAELLRTMHDDFDVLHTDVDNQTMREQLQPDVEQWADMLARDAVFRGKSVVVDLSSLPPENVLAMARTFQQAGFQQELIQVLPGPQQTLVDQFTTMVADQKHWEFVSADRRSENQLQSTPWLAGLEPREPQPAVRVYEDGATKRAITAEAVTLVANGVDKITLVNGKGATLQDAEGKPFDSHVKPELLNPSGYGTALDQARQGKRLEGAELGEALRSWSNLSAQIANPVGQEGMVSPSRSVLQKAVIGHYTRIARQVEFDRSAHEIAQMARDYGYVVREYRPAPQGSTHPSRPPPGNSELDNLSGKIPVLQTRHHEAYLVGASGGSGGGRMDRAEPQGTVLVVASETLVQHLARKAQLQGQEVAGQQVARGARGSGPTSGKNVGV